MRLKYNILWFENDADYIESARLRIEEFLDDLGFLLEIGSYPGSAFDGGVVRSEKWNLILMDYDLGERDKNGATVIESIRKMNVPTEVIFYSSVKENVEKVVNNQSFEGIYWCDRDKEFDEKVKSVIELTLRKVMDVTNMRGLVLAETADIDQKMDEIIAYCHDSEAEGEAQSLFRSGLIDIVMNSCAACGKRLGALDPAQCEIKTFQDTRVFSSFHKVAAIQAVTRPYKKIDPIKDIRNEFNTHTSGVIKIRNNLAHVTSAIVDGKEVIVNDDFVFDTSKAKEVRVLLKQYIQNLDLLFDELKVKLDHK